MIAKLWAAIFGANKSKPVKAGSTRPVRKMESWRLSYTRDGRYFLQGWLNGAYTTSDYIKELSDGVVIDVLGNRFSLGEPDGGEWAYSLKLRFPQGYEWFKNAGILTA